MSRRLPSLFFASCLLVVWTACVGDDPVTGGSGGGPAMGDRLGACFDDGKCKEGLECRLPERICLTPGEPVPPDAGIDGSIGPEPGGDAAAGDARPDAPADGGSCTPKQAPSPGIYCTNGRCGTAEGCCSNQNTVLGCNTQNGCATIGGTRYFACDGPASCGPGLFCCLTGTASQTDGQNACSGRYVATNTACLANACDLQQKITLCSSSSDCGGGTCAPVEIELATGAIVIWGRCVK